MDQKAGLEIAETGVDMDAAEEQQRRRNELLSFRVVAVPKDERQKSKLWREELLHTATTGFSTKEEKSIVP